MKSASDLLVELLSFNVEAEGCFAHITWSTASEINNDYFSIEYSYDGVDWTEIDIEGCDEICYYRLKQFDFDGQSEESKIIVLESENQNQEFKISVSPNPVNQMANIAFTVPESGMFSLTVTTQTGQVMYTAKTIGDKGNNHISCNASMLTSGSYYFILEDENGKCTQQLVIK